MDVTLLVSLAKLRAVIAYLGEHEQFGWWQSSFFSPGGRAFLSPVFAKTHVMAQCVGAAQAAALVHDERIGVGDVYHLFRLPEDIEQRLHTTLADARFGGEITALVGSRESALTVLRTQARAIRAPGIGPVRIGIAEELRSPSSWKVVTAHYLDAFEHGAQSYPYFTGQRG